MSRLFGTDGVRGVAGAELTIELATKLGQAGAYVLTKEQAHKPTIIVGCDTRISGGMLASALMAGICSVGANAIYAGVMPTPAIAYLTRKHKVDAGVVISASHNPMEFNGIKFFNGSGYKLSDALEDEIEAFSQIKGLELQYTEIDMHNTDDSEEGLQKQAERYKEFFDVLTKMDREGKANITSVTFWGLKDGESWLSGFKGETSYPLLFTDDMEKKPCYESILEAGKTAGK